MKAILFDLDETLIEDDAISEHAFLAAARLAVDRGVADAKRLAASAGAIARRRWQESPYRDYCDRIGHSAWEGLWARYNAGEHPTIQSLAEWAPQYRLAVWSEGLEQQGIADAALAKAMAERFMAERRRYPWYPEIESVLTALRTQYLLGIVTNGVPDLQREKIAGSGLAPWFQTSVVSGEIDCGKPDPGIFQSICQTLGVEPADCVMVGDNPGRDVAGAIAAGCRSVWVQRGGRARDDRYPADLECTTLADLPRWLEELGRA